MRNVINWSEENRGSQFSGMKFAPSKNRANENLQNANRDLPKWQFDKKCRQFLSLYKKYTAKMADGGRGSGERIRRKFEKLGSDF